MRSLSIDSRADRESAWGGGLSRRRRWCAWLVAVVVAPVLLMVRDMPAAAEELGLTFEHKCTPDTFRPGEWVVVECVARSANEGRDTLTDISWSVGGTYSGTLPDYFFVWSKRDGEPQPANTGGLMFGGYDLRPGQTAETRTVLLLRMSEGTFETELDLTAQGWEVLVLTKPIRFVARAEAADPPGDLLVTKELVGGPAGEEAMPTATYETRITNQGSSPITELRVTDRYSYSMVRVDVQPAPASRTDELQIASWDLASFEKESLAPGESLVLRTTYGPDEMIDCEYATTGVVVEATVDGQERRYGARAEEGAELGECDYGGMHGGRGGGGGPVAFGRGGEGPSSSGGDARWAAAFLAAGGATLMGAASRERRLRCVC